MLRLKSEIDLHKPGLRLDATDPTKAVSLMKINQKLNDVPLLFI